MYLLGIDVGSSSVKASIVDGDSGNCIASAFYPKQEMKITALQPGWAEQAPELWWENMKLSIREVLSQSKIEPGSIDSIGISYQMHGLVLVDKKQEVLRPSIIWCDSRAAVYGNRAFTDLGEQFCLSQLLNSPGNFTASKLKWVQENEPELYHRIDKIMLPGDYIAMRLSGDVKTTASGLSEGILWNFKENIVANDLLKYYGFDPSLIPEIAPTFSVQSVVHAHAAQELGLAEGTKISYRAGDQPNNALSLNVLNPGEIATTAGTSGVVYGVSGEVKYDPLSRVNTFAHVNHTNSDPRLGVLLCINGTGILNSWLNKYVGNRAFSYSEMNEKAASVAIGSEGLTILPFGNGSERVLQNKNIGAQISGLGFNTHTDAHLFRAAQEGIVFSFRYGMEIMENIGIQAKVIRAGKANMFLSPIFRESLAGVTGATIELYDTDGSVGAARGAGIGSGYYASAKEAFSGLQKLDTVHPDTSKKTEYEEAYQNWKSQLIKLL
jgi:xylulokinase